MLQQSKEFSSLLHITVIIYNFFGNWLLVNLWKPTSTSVQSIIRNWSTWCWIKCMPEHVVREQYSLGKKCKYVRSLKFDL